MRHSCTLFNFTFKNWLLVLIPKHSKNVPRFGMVYTHPIFRLYLGKDYHGPLYVLCFESVILLARKAHLQIQERTKRESALSSLQGTVSHTIYQLPILLQWQLTVVVPFSPFLSQFCIFYIYIAELDLALKMNELFAAKQPTINHASNMFASEWHTTVRWGLQVHF